MNILAFRPPRLALSILVLATGFHVLLPASRLWLLNHTLLGSLAVVSGFGIMMAGWWLFKKFDVAVCPTARTSTVIKQGIYQWTRNPMYLGLSLMMLGIAMIVGSLPFYVATVVFFLVIDRVFCPYEENKLEILFGEEYREYKNRVRRWL